MTAAASRQHVHGAPVHRPKGRLLPGEQLLVAAFLLALVPPLLQLGRVLDTNTLTSWRWIMAPGRFAGLFLLYCALVPALVWLSGVVPLERLPLPGLMGMALVLLLPLHSLPELLLDSGRYFLQASYLAEHGLPAYLRQWGGEVWAWSDMPLSGLLYGLLFRLVGVQRLAAQLLNLALYTGCVVLLWGIGRQLWDSRTACFSALLFLAMPLPLFLSSQLGNDLHVLCCLLLLLYGSLRTLAGGGRGWLALTAAAVLGTAVVKYSTWAMLAALGSVLFLFPPARHAHRLRLLWAWLAGLGAALLFLALKQEVVTSQLMLLFTYQRQGLATWREGYLSTFCWQMHPFLPLLAALAVWHGCRLRDRRVLTVSWFVPLMFALGMARSRYLLPFFPLLALLAGRGLAYLGTPRLHRLVVGGVLAWSLMVLYGAQVPFLAGSSMANLQAAAQALEQLPAAECLVRVLPQQRSQGDTAAVLPILDLYSGKKLHFASRPPGARPVHYQTALQFSRELPLDRYRSVADSPAPSPLLVVGDGRIDPVWQGGLEEWRIRRFTAAADPFRFKTLVWLAVPVARQRRITAAAAAMAQKDHIVPGTVPNGTDYAILEASPSR